MPDGPLQNLKLIELGHVIAGPMAATLLADFGAEVVKIEAPASPDMMRELGPKNTEGTAVWWQTLARNKRLLALDWKSPEGLRILQALVKESDVLIENFRPGVLERAGIGPDVLHGWNPDLVILRISGYGQTGPYVKRPVFGRAAEAMSGLPHLTGPAGGTPMHAGFPVADTTTGLMGALGIMMALYAVKDGVARGQVIDLAVFETLLRLIDYHVPALTGVGQSLARNGNRQPMDFVPGGVFRTRDGIWVTISAGSVETAQRLLRSVGGDVWAGQDRFTHMEGIAANMDEITAKLDSFIAARNFDEVDAAFRENDAVAAPILSVDEIVAHPQVVHRGNIVALDGEKTRVVGPVPQFEKTPGKVNWLGGDSVGEHTRAILEELGYGADEIDALVGNGIVAVPENRGAADA